MFNTGQQDLQPRQRVFRHAIDRWQVQLAQAPIGDVADIGLDILGRHALNLTGLEGQIDELIFQTDHVLAAVDNIVGHRLGDHAGLGIEGVIELNNTFAVQALIAHGPGHDLAHPLHLVEAREVHQHGKGRKEL